MVQIHLIHIEREKRRDLIPVPSTESSKNLVIINVNY